MRPPGEGLQHGGPGEGMVLLPQPEFQCPAVAQMGCSRRTGMAKGMLEQAQQTTGGAGPGHELRRLPQESPWWGQLQRQPRAVVGNNAPAIQCRAHMAGQAPIRRHQGGLATLLQGMAQPQGNGEGLLPQVGGLQQGESCRGRVQATQGRTLRQPGIRHRRRAQRQRHQAVAGRGCRLGLCPGLHRLGVHPEGLQQVIKALLGVVLCGSGLIQLGPHRRGQVKVESRQHHRPLVQAGRGFHQQLGAAPGARGARHNHRMAGRVLPPVGNQAFDHLPLPRLGVQAADGMEILLHQAEKRLGALPVAREFPHVQILDCLGINALPLEFIHQAGQAGGQVVAAGAGSQLRLLLQQLADELPQLQPTPQGKDGGGQHQGLGCVAVVGGHQVNGGQQAGGGAVKQLRQPPSHALAVHHQVNPRQGFGWLPTEALPQPLEQNCREVHPRRRAIDPWRGGCWKQGEHRQARPHGVADRELNHRTLPFSTMHPPTIYDLWRPRQDVLAGRIRDEDFAADLSQVLRGTATELH